MNINSPENAPQSPNKPSRTPVRSRTRIKSSINLDNPDFYFNRELSWLEFNARVLEEAQDKSHPLLERLKFLSIFSSNLDEFFMVRVAGLKQSLVRGASETGPDNLSPQEQLNRIHMRLWPMVDTQYKIFHRDIVPGLKKNHIFLAKIADLNRTQLQFVTDYFMKQVYAVLTPLAIDPGHPFPQLGNRTLNLAILLKEKKRRNDEKSYFAVVQVPSVIKRFVSIPHKGVGHIYIPLGEIIKYFAERLFPGFSVMDIGTFRVTRNADLFIDEEEQEDLLTIIEEELRKRERGEAVRLELEKNVSPNLTKMLLKSLNLTTKDLYHINGPINLPDLMFIYQNPDLKHLRDESFTPNIPKALKGKGNIFDIIAAGDVLLHHPFESFSPVVDFVNSAAEDPNVLAIKLSLYRTSGDSPIIDALVKAVENGKQVTALIELKARFDEENNISWARALEKAGVHVVYGFVGLKTHCKVLQVVRKEDDKLRRYIHLGTGNYNPSTAKLYTDLGLFTCRDDFGSDISELFNLLTGYYQNPHWLKIIAAPIGLKDRMLEFIHDEIKFHKTLGNGHIIAKMNSLVDADIIKAIYAASQAGVRIDLNIRGICCLRPGIPGVSDNIQVISIVDRFLEHSRIYYFHHGGKQLVYIGSADWMPRNFIRRVEVVFPIEEESLKQRIINEILAVIFADNVKARVLKNDGSYVKIRRNRKKSFRSQAVFMQLAIEREKTEEMGDTSESNLAELIKPRDYTEAAQTLGITPETHRKKIQEKKLITEEE